MDEVLDPQPTAADLAKFATRGPRYTSYPPAPHFTSEIGDADVKQYLAAIAANATDGKISLYTHIPFCRALCWYCGCNVKVTRDRSQGDRYVKTLIREIELYGEQLPGLQLGELSLGGGSPNFLSTDTMRTLIDAIRRVFPPSEDAVLGIELDPRDTSLEMVSELAAMGFTRLNVGVQDFDLKVQDTINRHQSREDTEALFTHARDSGFQSSGVDLIYGLPGQSEETFVQTLDAVTAMDPDRIALFGYAHLPHIIKHQKLVERQPIPNIPARAALLTCAIRVLGEAGYVRVGFDHFAKPSDPLAQAVQHKSLHRNFQGFTTAQNGPLLACGVTGISDSGDAYWQNVSAIDAWTSAIEAGTFPVARGLALSSEDHIRRHLIYALMCDSEIDVAKTEEKFEIDFSEFFHHELERLKEPEIAPLVDVRLEEGTIRPTRLGFELIRNVCMVFDRNLRGVKAAGSTTI